MTLVDGAINCTEGKLNMADEPVLKLNLVDVYGNPLDETVRLRTTTTPAAIRPKTAMATYSLHFLPARKTGKPTSTSTMPPVSKTFFRLFTIHYRISQPTHTTSTKSSSATKTSTRDIRLRCETLTGTRLGFCSNTRRLVKQWRRL